MKHLKSFKIFENNLEKEDLFYYSSVVSSYTQAIQKALNNNKIEKNSLKNLTEDLKKVVDKHIKDNEILNALKSKIDFDKKMAYDKTNLLGLL